MKKIGLFRRDFIVLLLISILKPRHPWSWHAWKLWEDSEDSIDCVWGRLSLQRAKPLDSTRAARSAKADVLLVYTGRKAYSAISLRPWLSKIQLLCKLWFWGGKKYVCGHTISCISHYWEQVKRLVFLLLQ